MGNKFLKQKAVFMIYLTISLIFTITLIQPVFAEDDTATTNACCERTVSGDSCIYTNIENCDENYDNKPFQYCEDTQMCKVGCCVSEEDGSCSKQTLKATCEAEGFQWYEDPNCEVPMCQKGCCVLAEASCAFVTEQKCDNILENYPELEKDFRESDSEIECTDICRQADRGCCVTEGGESCLWSTRGTCGMQDGTGGDGFYMDVFCSNENLPCDCEYHGGNKNCLDGSDNVYWYDSCGNPEDIADECDYAGEGYICSEADENHEEAYCKNVNCPETWDDPTSNSLTAGGPKKNGESWCSYDALTGPNSDTVGSRHYRHMCMNGLEIVEPCKDYREAVCLDSTGEEDAPEGLPSAKCKDNRWQDCAEECATAKDASDEYERYTMMRTDKRCCEREDLRDCVWVGDEISGLCIPKYAPGLKFWDDDEEVGETPSAEAATECEKGSYELKAQWVTRGARNDGNDKKYWCKQNCEIYTDEFLAERNQYCRSLGDCGAHYNYREGFSDVGFIRTWSKLAPCHEEGLPSCGDWNDIRATIAHNLLDDEDPGKGRVYKEDCQEETKHFVTDDLAGEFQTSWTDTIESLNLANFDIGESWGTGWSGKWGAVLAGFLSAAALCLPCGISDLITGWPYNHDRTATFECKAWEAPEGGDECSECDKPFKPCSEYRCRSLGTQCRFILENEGTGRETCFSASRKDVSKPVVTWNEEAFEVISNREDITSEFSTDSTQSGMEIEGKLPAFSKVTFGITTDELSQCFIDTEFSDPMTLYDLTTPFPDTFYSREHNITYNNLEPNKEYTFFIGCTDALGNPGVEGYVTPYVVELETDDAPDMSAPRIVAVEEPALGKVAAHKNETEIWVHVDESSAFNCKIAKEDQDYELMQQYMGCQNNPPNSILSSFSLCVSTVNISEGENTIYIRCEDDPDDVEPNTNTESYEVTFEKTTPLAITAAGPSGDLYQRNITMYVETAGGVDNGRSRCVYLGVQASGVFGITNTSSHQNVFSDLIENTYVFNVTCRDDISNIDETQIVFTSKRDYDAPQVNNVYKQGSTVYLLLSEPATCEYANDTFVYGYGTTSSVNTQTHTFSGQDSYYVICEDVFANQMDSVIVYPYLPKIEKVSGSSISS